MIEPPPAAVIGSTATRMPRKVPVKLTSITFCHLSRSKFFSCPSATVPALFTSTLSLPNSLGRRGDRGVPLVGLGDVEVDIACGVADFVGQRFALVVEDVADHHLGAFLDEQASVLGAHPAGAATDECDFSLYPSRTFHGGAPFDVVQ